MLDFAAPRVAQLRWLAIKRGFIQRIPKLTEGNVASENDVIFYFLIAISGKFFKTVYTAKLVTKKQRY